VRLLCLPAVIVLAAGGVGTAAAASKGQTVRVASLRATVPTGWTWASERGGYANCSNPIAKLWLASYRLPKGFGKREGSLVVPAGQVLVGFVAKPVRSSSTLWKQWRVSNAKLRPAAAVGGSRYKAELAFPGTPAVGATLWSGDRRLSSALLRATNRVFASLSVDPAYGCR
jgi:hypothetical protein